VGEGEEAGEGVVVAGDGFETEVGELIRDFFDAFGGVRLDDYVARAPSGDGDACIAAEVAGLVEPGGFFFVAGENSHERSLREKMAVCEVMARDGNTGREDRGTKAMASREYEWRV
jgi:hypothetical protein